VQGKLFRILITKSSSNSGYALSRAYPRDANHKRFDVQRIEEVVAMMARRLGRP
jgi:hypothetical protein